ncbi:MAG: hypothetical protein KIS67_00185 [Verrucomicrobiae bacterium]|nr:hypothetical protein [Verrucomicrobiae bacterium]
MRTFMICSGIFVACLTLAISSIRPEFSIGVLPTGNIAGEAWGFIASITNTGRSSPIVDTVRVEWRDAVGIKDSFHFFSGSKRRWSPHSVETTTFQVPARAQKVRVCVMVDETSPIKQHFTRLALKLPLDRIPRLTVWLCERGLLFPETELQSYPGEWRPVQLKEDICDA